MKIVLGTNLTIAMMYRTLEATRTLAAHLSLSPEEKKGCLERPRRFRTSADDTLLLLLLPEGSSTIMLTGTTVNEKLPSCSSCSVCVCVWSRCLLDDGVPPMFNDFAAAVCFFRTTES